MVALRSMSPYVALEGQGISKILVTGSTGKKTNPVVLLGVGQAPWVTVATLTLLTAAGVRDTIGFLTVRVSR